ncbi:MAG TPA: hypothetical protein VEL11_05540 [Candidatus Bathyarchaeia archaeon]|nr:hypothetical protein [Candidatus Bathyarchaeia archaeon]
MLFRIFVCNKLTPTVDRKIKNMNELVSWGLGAALGYISKVGGTANILKLKLTFASVERNAMMTKEATYLGGSSHMDLD